MRNRFEVRENCIVIYLEQKNGTVYETLVDIEHLRILHPLDVKWTAVKWTGTRGVYVQGTLGLGNGKYETLILHRILTNAPKGKIVDHINHDTLDNRLINLRVVSKSQNNQNKQGLHSSNTSGVRGVTWNKKNSRWLVQTQFQGKKIYLGSFKELSDAEDAFGGFVNNFFLTNKSSEEKEFTYKDVAEYAKNLRNGHRLGMSGKRYIQFHNQTGKWSVVYKGKRYGLQDTIEKSEIVLNQILREGL